MIYLVAMAIGLLTAYMGYGPITWEFWAMWILIVLFGATSGAN